MLIISPEYTPVTQIILCIFFFLNVCSNHTKFKLQRTKIQNVQFALYISDAPVTFKQRQGHHPWNNNVDSKQGNNDAKLKALDLMVPKKKPVLNVFPNM